MAMTVGSTPIYYIYGHDDISISLSFDNITSQTIDLNIVGISSLWDKFDITIEYSSGEDKEWNNNPFITSVSSDYYRKNVVYGLSASETGVVNTITWKYIENGIAYGSQPKIRLKILPRTMFFGGSVSDNSCVSELYGEDNVDFTGISDKKFVNRDHNGNYIRLDASSIYVYENIDDASPLYTYSLLSYPQHVYCMNSGNYIVADYGNIRVIELDSTLSNIVRSVTVSAPYFVDYNEDNETLLVTSYTFGLILEYTWSDTDYNTPLWSSALITSLSNPRCATYKQDTSNKIVVADYGNNRIVKIDRLNDTVDYVYRYSLYSGDSADCDTCSFIYPYRVFWYENGNIQVIEEKGMVLDLGTIESSSSTSSSSSEGYTTSSSSSSAGYTTSSSSSSESSSSQYGYFELRNAGTPAANGYYREDGVEGGKISYKNIYEEWYLFWSVGAGKWYINPTKSQTVTSPYWIRNDVSPFGIYIAGFGAGTPIFYADTATSSSSSSVGSSSSSSSSLSS